MFKKNLFHLSVLILSGLVTFCTQLKKEDAKEAEQKKLELEKQIQETNYDSLILDVPYKPDEFFKKATEAFLAKNYNESSAYIRSAMDIIQSIPVRDSVERNKIDDQIISLNNLAQDIRDRRVWDVNKLEEEFIKTNAMMAEMGYFINEEYNK